MDECVQESRFHFEALGCVPEIVFEAGLVLEDDCATFEESQFGALGFIFCAQHILWVYVADNQNVEQDC